MKKGLIFDVDGVIIDVSHSYHYAIKNTAERFLGRGLDINLVREIKFKKGINNDYLATLEVIKTFGGSASLEEVVEVFDQEYEKLKEMEGLILSRDFFKKLRDLKVPIGILTGRPRRDLKDAFDRFELWEFFDVVVDDDTIEQPSLRKPNPYALNFCMEKMNLDFAVYVGDSLADYQMVEGFKRQYAKRVDYIHFGDRVLPPSAKVVRSEEELFQALKEALQNQEAV
ncbi:MAG: HAD family hydrolase [Thermocrinis sp.]|jgi:HAD superfamily phosphatase|uniref:HAD family hydrolase n=1 Tax=Thermocrinis sp. TaxID=2024383 RepID=UPI003BFAC5C5